jgi:hypothetical protein
MRAKLEGMASELHSVNLATGKSGMAKRLL